MHRVCADLNNGAMKAGLARAKETCMMRWHTSRSMDEPEDRVQGKRCGMVTVCGRSEGCRMWLGYPSHLSGWAGNWREKTEDEGVRKDASDRIPYKDFRSCFECVESPVGISCLPVLVFWERVSLCKLGCCQTGDLPKIRTVSFPVVVVVGYTNQLQWPWSLW